MRQLILFLTCLLTMNTSYAQKKEMYSRAKVHLDAAHSIQVLAALGVAIDHGEYKKNTFFVSDFSAAEIERVRAAGFKVDVLIADVAEHYIGQNKHRAMAKTTNVTCEEPMQPTPAHFQLGSYGGYYTYTELMSILDQMQQLYPNLISVKQPISNFQTIEGNPIYWLRVSNNPSVSQPAKPQGLYTALHHAREPGSISQMIFFLWHMLERYATDDRIKAIIDNTELYFIPCVNPDGYQYNIMTDPFGGGMWRKNRRDNLDGTYGVDLNRNYGYFWGYDDLGSSPFTMTDIYRGPSGFSEVETQAVKWFTEQHNFRICLNYHSFHNVLIYPWGYEAGLLSPDSMTFVSYADLLTKHNDYRHGTGDQVLGYSTNGGSDDWMYGDVSTKPEILAMTPEVGAMSNGFYAPQWDIIPDCENNLLANINMASLLLSHATATSQERKIITQPSGYLNYKLQRLGLEDNATYTVSIIPLDSWMNVAGSPKVYNSLSLLQSLEDSMSYTIAASTPNHQLVSYVLRVNNGHYDQDDTIRFYYGQQYTITEPSANSLTDWNNFGWGLSADAYSPPYSIQSSVSGNSNYDDNAVLSISTAAPIDLTHSVEAYLYFYSKWTVETNYDYVAVRGSVNNSGIWQELCGQYTRPHPAVTTAPIYDGYRPQWVREEIDLHDYLGQQLDIEFYLKSDAAVNYEGFYFDDVTVITIQDSTNSVTPLGRDAVVNIYPNPANDHLTIALEGISAPAALQGVIFDCYGRKVKTFAMNGDQITLDVAQLSSGLYAVKLYSAGSVVQVQKLSIIH